MNIFKSKTINFNILATALVSILTGVGVDVPIEAVTGVFALGNFVLRFFTKEPLSTK